MSDYSLKDFIKAIYEEGNNYVGTKYLPYPIRAKQIGDEKVNRDHHMTVNYIKKDCRRSEENVTYLNAIKVDLDTVNEAIEAYKDPHAAYDILIEKYFGKLLPTPTVVNFSGAGLHVLWKLDTLISKHAVSLYIKITTRFCEILSDFGPDIGASTLPHGVLRVPGTINEKHGNIVEILYCNKENRYSFKELCKEYIDYDCNDNGGPATDKQRFFLHAIETTLQTVFPENYKSNKKNACRTIQKNYDEYKRVLAEEMQAEPITDAQMNRILSLCRKQGLEIPDITNKYDASKWIDEHKMTIDLPTTSLKDCTAAVTLNAVLLFMDKNRKNNYKREVALYIVRMSAAILYGKEKAEEIMLEANSMLDEPFKTRSILTKTNSVNTYMDRNKPRCYGAKRAAFMITNDYEAFNDYISHSVSKKEKDKKRYRDKVHSQGKKTKHEEIADRVKTILSLRQDGKTNKEISDILGIAVRTIQETIQKYRIKMGGAENSAYITNNVQLEITPPLGYEREAIAQSCESNDSLFVSNGSLSNIIYQLTLKEDNRILSVGCIEVTIPPKKRSPFAFLPTECLRLVLDNDNKAHSWISEELFYKKLLANLKKAGYQISIDLINRFLDISGIYHNNGRIALKSIYQSEIYIRDRIRYSQYCPHKYAEFEPIDESGILSTEQLNAAKELLRSPGSISMLTGGPGTGKSTIIEAIVAGIAKEYPDDKIAILTPTGKATDRIQKSFKGKAYNKCKTATVHGFIGKKMDGTIDQQQNAMVKNCSLIIIDECSMLDYIILHILLKSVDLEHTKLIFVGDEYQLESVERGALITDFKDIGLPMLELTENHRSNILIQKNAKAINNGNPNLETNASFEIIEAPIEEIKDRLGNYDENRMIISPHNNERYDDNTKELNLLMQKNRFGIGYPTLGGKYFPGDNVMFLKNNYREGYFNGQTGIVREYYFQSKTYKVELDDGRTVDVTESDIDLAYALTVHKSQGSEYNIVDIVIAGYISRKLLYTAVTRAKEKVRIWVTDMKFLTNAIENEPKRRRSFLLDEPMPELEDDYDMAL